MTFPIEICGQHFILHASGAMFWQEKNLLLISDVHLGKVMHFRKHGMALPTRSAAGNFVQLDAVADFFQAETICFLGDLFHSQMNIEWELFADWSAKRNEEIVLIAGNHDIIKPAAYEQLGIAVLPEWITEDFLLVHEPQTREKLFTICGHIHPGVRLRGTGRQLLQLPCFFQSEQQLILPAFGEFTGKYLLTPSENDRVYAVTREEVIPVRLS